MTTWAWTLLTLLFLWVEGALVGSFVAVFFALGSLCAAVASGVGACPDIWQQCVVFAAVATGSVALARQPLLGWARAAQRAHPIEPIAGSLARVSRAMAGGALGEVSLHGTKWAARNASSASLALHAQCRVLHIEGLTLVVQPHDLLPHKDDVS